MRRIRTIGILCCLLVLIWPYAVKDVLGAVPFTFTPGAKAKADEVNANFNDLDTRLASFEGGQQGSTTSVGCRDKSPSAPDCGFCPSGNCVIGSTTYPSQRWMHLATYILPAHGELVVSVGPSVVCDQNVSAGEVLGLSIAVADASAGFPPADPASGVISYEELVLGSVPAQYELIPWRVPLLVGRTMTQGRLTPSSTYKIFLVASVGATWSGTCFFIESSVHLQFTPLPSTTVTITPN